MTAPTLEELWALLLTADTSAIFEASPCPWCGVPAVPFQRGGAYHHRASCKWAQALERKEQWDKSLSSSSQSSGESSDPSSSDTSIKRETVWLLQGPSTRVFTTEARAKDYVAAFELHVAQFNHNFNSTWSLSEVVLDLHGPGKTPDL